VHRFMMLDAVAYVHTNISYLSDLDFVFDSDLALATSR